MAINQNHLFEDLDGVKCGIAEKNASPERVAFLKDLLEANNFTVVVVKSPPPKTAAKPAAAPVEGAPAPAPEPVVEGPNTFTVGVTDVRFNPTNYIFGRLLRTKDGHVVTLAYWQQKDSVSHDDVPYYVVG
ncbi:MAG: hypothetical protein IPP51_04275 [Bacteroidetes bacterium]|nr:hypothetical protein [Bacteroidota bacterium]